MDGSETRQASWRICIDFGTAASKAALSIAGLKGADALDYMHPLEIGAAAGEQTPFIAPSALLFDKGRVLFGAAALDEANSAEVEPLQSFKTFLGARDLEDALGFKLRRSVDASGLFSQRDALVLYTAYLMRLVETALARDAHVPAGAHLSPRRYAYPNWRPGARANQILAGVFDIAEAVSQNLGEALLARTGINFEEARRALKDAYAAPGQGRIEAGVFEARAAAECHFALSPDMPDFVIVFDMGAGTTDMTAFECVGQGANRTMREIAQARQTSALACDEVDKIIVARMSSKAKGEKRRGARKQFWRRLSTRARKLKENLFRDGQCDAIYEGQKISLKLAEFMHDRNFLAFYSALFDTYRGFLTEIGIRAAADGKDAIGVVLAGGGSSLPFVQQMAQKTRPKVSRIRRVLVQPVVPSWIYDHHHARALAPIFPQLAIALGGAVAVLGDAATEAERAA
jgi:molecular chaperone DnaK (HSP70)